VFAVDKRHVTLEHALVPSLLQGCEGHLQHVLKLRQQRSLYLCERSEAAGSRTRKREYTNIQ
jgi:hypothetical protein